MQEIARIATAFDRVCRAQDVAYAYIGGLAVMAWGQPRATADVDVLIDLREVDLGAFASELGAHGLTVQPLDLEDARRGGGHATVFDDGSHFHLDLKAVRTAAERAQVEKGVDVEVDGAKLRIASPEDTIAFKLKFGSPQDLQDARSILVRSKNVLDDKRLVALCVSLRVAEALKRLRAEIAEAERG